MGRTVNGRWPTVADRPAAELHAEWLAKQPMTAGEHTVAGLYDYPVVLMRFARAEQALADIEALCSDALHVQPHRAVRSVSVPAIRAALRASQGSQT